MPNITLKAVAGELQILDATSTGYLHRRTGEVVIVQQEDARHAEDPDDASLPDWHREMLATVREVLAGDEWLELPSRFDIDPYRIMERFCFSIAPDEGGERLQQAIQGSGAFRRFRDEVSRLGLEERWYAHQDQAYRRIVARWLEGHEIPFRDQPG